ncbi:MAG: hypothetical protein PHU30_06920 [Oscillospiraceae bacterium]|nr:hypothetical protein [Oscillospiraceae bacterium]
MSVSTKNLRFYGLDHRTFRFDLPRPLEFELVQSFDSPAHSFEAIFPCDQLDPEFHYVEFWNGNKRLFRGMTDEQTITVNDTGRRLKLIARSQGALLLDNEARPQKHENIDLKDMFDCHLRPYGFMYLDADYIPFFNNFPIQKGTSEWEAFYRFFRNSNHGTPYITADNRVVCHLDPNTGVTHKISNQDPDALHYSNLKMVNNRYSPITEYIIRNQDGLYSYCYQNPDQTTGLTRRRYLIPSGEFLDRDFRGWNEAAVRILRSMLGKQVITVTVPGYQDASICDRVALDWELQTFPSLFVHQLRWKMSAAGMTTTFTLLDPQYL